MSAVEYVTVDRTGWDSGPWDDEPDKVQWTDEATGMACLAVRARSGHLCGYVAVPPGHRFFEVGYDEVRLVADEFDYDRDCPPAHGGLTYADHCQDGPEDSAICHIPAAGEPDHVWWLGFDCAHSGDLSPGRMARDREMGMLYGNTPWPESYKTLAYVKRNCVDLAAWLVAADRATS